MTTAIAVPTIADPSARFVRQADFVPHARLCDTPIAIIGVGAIGRQVALQLASIGARHLVIVDFDGVTATNVTTQGFLASDVGDEKVIAVERAIKAIDPTIQVDAICDRWRPTMELPRVVFSCVDSITVRKLIFNTIKDDCDLFVDTRMLGEGMRVLAISGQNAKDYYPSTLFTEEEAEQGRCTAHATIYCGTICGGLAVHQFTRWLRNMPLDTDTGFNMLAGELFSIHS